MKIEKSVDLKSLIGKTIERKGAGDVILRVGCVSIRHNILVHAEGLESFGWTFMLSDGELCGDWFYVEQGDKI